MSNLGIHRRTPAAPELATTDVAPLPSTAPARTTPTSSPPLAAQLAPTRAKAALGGAGVQVVLGGVTALATRAQGQPPAPALAALRQITKQLDALKPSDVAQLTTPGALELLAPLAATLARATQAPGRTGAEAVRAGHALSAAVDRLALPLGGAALQGPARAALAAAADAPASRALLAEALAHHPHPVEALEILGRAPDLSAMLAKAAKMYPPRIARTGGTDRAAHAGALDRDLAAGAIGGQLEARMKALGLSSTDTAAFFSAFAEVRAGFEAGAQLGDDMQRVNWMHTRIEILHTLQSAEALGLDAHTPEGRRGLLAAMYGSLCSDAFKDKGTFSLLWHNRPGAELIAPLVMGRVMDLSQPDDAELLRWTMRVAHEHQVTPPLFMAGPMKGTLAKLVAEAPEGAPRQRAQAAADEVFQAVSKPMSAPQQGGEIVFSDDARALLEQAGLSGWAVPHDAPWRAASMAAIAGDVWQYMSPEGVIKIAVDLRDPGSPAGPFMRDPVISMGWLSEAHPERADELRTLGQGGAVESSVGFSYGQGTSVIDDPRLLAVMKEHRGAMDTMLRQQVLPEVEARLRRALDVPSGQPTPAIPYWNAAVPTDGQLDAAQRRSVDLVKSTFQAVLSEAGQVPLAPFSGGSS